MNIRQTSLATSIALAALFIGVVVLELNMLRTEKLQQLNTGRIVETGSILSRGTIELSLERSVMQVTLNLPDPIPVPFRNLLDQQRTIFDQSLEAARLELQQVDIDPQVMDRLVRQLDQSEQEILSIRRQADELLARPRTQRDPEVVAALPGALKSAIIQLVSVPAILRSDDMRVSSRLQALLDIQYQAWAVREFGGQERTYLAIATASGEPLSDQIRGEMSQLHNRAATSMTRLRALASFEGLGARIPEQVALLESGYFGSYTELRQRLLSHDLNSGPYPVSFEDFFAQSSNALDLAVSLSVEAGQQTSEAIATYSADVWARFLTFVGILVAVIIICGGQLYYSQVQVSGRLSALAVLMRQLASGDTRIEISGQSRNDEIGEMARAVQVFKSNAIARVALEKKTIVERDRERQRQSFMEKLIKQFTTSLDGSAGDVREQAVSLLDTSKKLNSVAQEATANSDTANYATEQANSSVQTVAAAAEELSASITEIARQTEQAQTLMVDAARRAEASNEQVFQLNRSVDRIGTVVSLITEIAEQTNLLALNATIEAARAGEAGKGFAVVASEVKALATQTAKATDEIGIQIAEIQASTSQTAESIQAVTTAVRDIQDLTSAIVRSVDQQKGATHEIAQSVVAASAGTQTVLQSVGSVAGSIKTTTDEASSIRDAAGVLSSATEKMANEVKNFIESIADDVTQRRMALRTALSEVVLIETSGKRIHANFVDISETGARLTNIAQFPLGQAVHIELANSKRVSGKVVRHTNDGIAIHFDCPIEQLDELVIRAA